MWPPLSLMRVDARVGQRLEADSGEGEPDSLSLLSGHLPPPPFHLLTLQVNTSGKLSFTILVRISFPRTPPSHSHLPPTTIQTGLNLNNVFLTSFVAFSYLLSAFI